MRRYEEPPADYRYKRWPVTTQTNNAPSAEEILAWLAAQPCPQSPAYWVPGLLGHRKECRGGCQGSGLAFAWASKKCIAWRYKPDAYDEPNHDERCCGGSGRVPKDVGLAELLPVLAEKDVVVSFSWIDRKKRQWWACEIEHISSMDSRDGVVGHGETPTEAALRAIAAQAGMPQGKDA